MSARDIARRTAWHALSNHADARPELIAAVREHEAHLCRESAAWRTYLRALQRSADQGHAAPPEPCAEPRTPRPGALPLVEALGALQQIDHAAAQAVATYAAELIRECTRWRTEARKLEEVLHHG